MRRNVSVEGVSLSPSLPFGSWIAFTFMGFALSLLWGALSFQAPLYDAAFGSGTWSLLVAAYNAPGLVSLLFQLWTDKAFERVVRRSRLWAWRVCVSLALCATCCALAPVVLSSGSRSGVVAFVVVVGVVVGLAHGWIYSFAALFPGSLPTSFLLVGSGVSTLALIGLGVGAQVDEAMSLAANLPRLWVYFGPAAGLTALGLVVSCAFSCGSAAGALLDGLDAHALLGGAMEEAADVASELGAPPRPRASDDDEHPPLLSRARVLRVVAVPMVCIALNTFVQVASVAVVTFVPNEQPCRYSMATVLLWSTSLAALVGSEAQTLVAPVERPGVLLFLSATHFVMLPLVVVYCVGRYFVNNAFFIAYMIVMTGTNGYLLSDSYKVANRLVKSRLAAHYAQIFMNVGLYVGVYAAIVTPYWLAPLAVAVRPDLVNATSGGVVFAKMNCSA